MTAESQPSVSVVVPTRGRPGPLRRALRSIACQEYDGEVQCVVVVDGDEPVGSLEPTLRVEVLRNERTPGPAGARNTGLLRSTTDLVAFCDDDDEWRPAKLRRQVERLVRDPGAVLAACGVTIHVDERTFDRRSPADSVSLDDLRRGRRADLHTSGFVVRREAIIERVGLMDEAIPAGYGEDYDWLLRAAAVHALAVVPDTLVDVHQEGSWFAGRWELIARALQHQLEHQPELSAHPRNLARVLGRLAFACAALGERRAARSWARQALAANWLEARAWLALAVSARVVPARMVTAGARRLGRGV